MLIDATWLVVLKFYANFLDIDYNYSYKFTIKISFLNNNIFYKMLMFKDFRAFAVSMMSMQSPINSMWKFKYIIITDNFIVFSK